MPSTVITKLQFAHLTLDNSPWIGTVFASTPPTGIRLFQGVGAPSYLNLQDGNNKYCATTGGYVVNGTLDAGGVNYVVGDIVTVSGGTVVTAPQITVDAVSATGAILDFHFSRVGNYSTYPTTTVSVTGGTGSGATFNLTLQPADMYLDTTAVALYVCTTQGDAAGSTWTQISGQGGGGNYVGGYVNDSAYTVGQIVRVTAIATYGSTATVLGTYGCVLAVPAAASGAGQIPTFPEPTNACWQLIAFGAQAVSSCSNGTVNIYVNSSNTF